MLWKPPGGGLLPGIAEGKLRMKEIDCTIDTPVALANKNSVQRGKIVGPTSKNPKKDTVVLVEWGGGKIEKIPIATLLSKAQGDEVAAELKAKAEVARAEAERKRLAAEQLENDFKEVFNKIHPEIQDKITQAAKLIGEAEELSEKYGIPFQPDVGIPFRMSYIPSTLQKKWAKLCIDDGLEFIYDHTGAYGGEYDGWQSSQVC